MQRPLLRRIQPKNQLESQVNEFKLQKLAEDIVDFKKETEVKVSNIIEKAESVASGAEEAILEVKSLPSKIKNDFEELTNEIVDALKEIKSEGLKGDKGEDADEEAMEKRLLAKIPEIDIDDIAEKASSLVKPTPASLKIIKESVELKDEEIVPKLNKATNLGDLKLSINNIKDWNNKWEDIKGEISRNKGGYHGGGFNNIANASGTVSTGLDTLKFTGSGVSSVTQTGRTVTVDIAGGGGSGTVTNIATAGLISGGPITTTGTITTSMATGKLVGRSTAGTGIMEEITVGSGLTLSGGTLTATGGGSGITVGSTTITSGTTTRVLYDNAGVVGEYAISGTGSVAMTNTPTLTTPIIGSIKDTNSNTILSLNPITSAVNYVQIENDVAGSSPHIRPAGSDTNINLHLEPKGTGVVAISGNGADATTRFRFLTTGASTGTGLTLASVITANRTITFPDATGTASLQTGLVANQIAYASDSNTISSLTTATYPSLTELSYVKGVTSSIQTQLNAKGAGTVTNTGGSLTANAIVLGAGTNDTKVVTGITTDGTSIINLGVNATTIGKIKMFGNTSGDVTIQPTAAAGTATVQTLPATTGTLVNRVTTGNGVSATNTNGALAFTLGAITPSTVNGNTITTGTGTLTLGAGKTLTVSNTLTLAGTDASTLNIGTGGTLGTAAFTNSTAYEVPLTFSTGLTRTVNTITVNTSQNISTLSNLTSNGLVTTSGGTGALSVTVPGTGVLTALAVNVGTAGAFVVNGGALGTPSSGTVTNLTGTASININGTVGATTPAAGTFTTGTINTSLTMADGANIILNSTTGTKIGTATTQKLAFFNSVPIVQPTGSVITALQNLGLGASLTIPASTITSGAALTKTDDTNVTLTLGGSPTTALLAASSLTLGWTGTLAVARGGTGGGSASITLFNNITGYTASGATGTTSTNLVFSTSPSITTPTFVTSATVPLIIGGTGTTSTLTLQPTSGVGASGSDIIFKVGNNGGTEAMRIDYLGNTTMTVALNVPQVFNAMATATVTSNAATITRANRNNKFTNSSAAAMTITLSTTSAAAGDMLLVQIYDFSAVAQTITWVNTENSTVTVPATSNGSTTLPLTVGFMWNASTSKWRCIASA